MSPLKCNGRPQYGKSVREQLAREALAGFVLEAVSRAAGFNATVPSWKTLLTAATLGGFPQQVDRRRDRVWE